MHAALIALLLTIATQAGADDAKLNPDEWTFLECKHAEGALLEIVTGENASLPLVLAISKNESSLIEMQNDWHFNDCRGWRHSFLECSDKKMAKEIQINRYTGSLGFTWDGGFELYRCKKLDGPLF